MPQENSRVFSSLETKILQEYRYLYESAPILSSSYDINLHRREVLSIVNSLPNSRIGRIYFIEISV